MTYGERAPQSGKTKIVNKPTVRLALPGGRLAGTGDVRLVFFGTESFSAPSLEKLLAAGWPVAAVVTKPDSHGGRGQKLLTPKVKEIAQQYGIKVWQPAKVSEIDAKIAALKPTHGILAAYGKLIPQSTIDLFPGGIINVHPSLLPKYRGPSPIETAILANDPTTGISLIRLSAGMDEGPVYTQEIVKLDGTEDRFSLSADLAQKGANLLLDRLSAIIGGWLTPKPQVGAEASYTKLLEKVDGLMDFEHKTAEQLEREVRAYLGFPKSRAKQYGSDIVVTKARVAQSKSDGSLVIKCRDSFLEILELIAPSGRTMSGTDFLHGYKK
ncbi:MAG: methionyl-tRNA formyltransferase [Candidatus Saccharimonadales bacterium]|jgi:methionyl-tRNA formyltransferase